jgi:hypothetical protein
VTNTKLEETLGRLSVLKWFPTNPYAITAIGEILRELCPTDGDATDLAREVLKSFDEWCGPQSLRKARAVILEAKLAKENERKLQAAYVVAGADRKEHEATCPGYLVELDSEARTVSVLPCRAGFGATDIKIWHWLRCRKGDVISPRLLREVLEAELAKRPGWVSLDTHYARLVCEGKQRLDTQKIGVMNPAGGLSVPAVFIPPMATPEDTGQGRTDHDGTNK